MTGFYVLMAMGRIKLLALINLAGAVAMLAAIVILAPRFGIVGAASARLVYGLMTLLIYRPLQVALRSSQTVSGEAPAMLEAM